jgi:hypothetical protein
VKRFAKVVTARNARRVFIIGAVLLAAAAWPRAEDPGQVRTLDDVLAESGDCEAESFGFAEEIVMARSVPAVGRVNDIGGFVARLDRHGRTLAMIDEAAYRVGAPARLMRAMAGVESSFDAKAKATTSSATGLYQFIEATWLSNVESHGHKYGLAGLARHIRRGPLNQPIVDDARMRDKILALREDIRLSAYLAAELTIDNTRRLEKLLARPVTGTEIYLTHVFGVTSAARFLKLAESAPGTIGAEIFPKEAKANPGLFLRRGKPATLGQIQRRFAVKMAKFDPAPVELATMEQVADVATR